MKSMYSNDGALMKMSPSSDLNPSRCYHQQSYSAKSPVAGVLSSFTAHRFSNGTARKGTIAPPVK